VHKSNAGKPNYPCSCMSLFTAPPKPDMSPGLIWRNPMRVFILAALAALTLGATVASAAVPNQPASQRQNYMEGGGG
jgi:hypothetical protein